MTDERIDDPILLAVRASRPAAAAVADPATSPRAQALLERIVSSPPTADRRRHQRTSPRWTDWTIPALGGVIAVLVAIVALVGLGHNHRAPGRPTVSGQGLALSPGQYVFAVGGDSSPRTSPQQLQNGLVLYRAEQILRARCMQQRGFHYPLEPTPSVSALPSATGYPSTFYPQPIASVYPEQALLALRQRDGLGIHTGRQQQGHDPDPVDRYLKTLPTARQQLWLQAFHGRNGCYGSAEVQLFGSRRAANLESSAPILIDNHLNTVAYNADGSIAQSSTRTAAAAAAWSRCMRTATGIAWPDENALITTLAKQSARREITLAVTDTKCAYSTGQAQTFAAAFRQAANHLPPPIQTDLQYLLTHRAYWIHRARTILSAAR